MELFSKVVTFVDDVFHGKQKQHFERTVFWIQKFLPHTTEAHLIAAYGHDIERAFRGPADVPEDYLDSTFLKNHQERGATIMADFLANEGASEAVIETVRHLISNHEVGGDTEQTALMDADSISFFETNAELFVKQKAPVEGYETVKAKLDWMFDRISSSERKDLVREQYEKWISALEAYKTN